MAAFAQTNTLPTSLLVNSMQNVTSSGTIWDNRSSQRQCSTFTYAVSSGTGSWAVQIEWSNTSANGPWTSFGSNGVVTSTGALTIGYGYGYHSWVRLNTTSGTTVSNFSCESQFYIPPNGSGTNVTISGSLVNNNVVLGASATSMKDSGFHVPASAFVGVSDAQTLTGKTIDTGANTFKVNGTTVNQLTGGPVLVSTVSTDPRTPGNLAEWDGSGNLVDAGFSPLSIPSFNVNFSLQGGTTGLSAELMFDSQWIDVRSFGAVGVAATGSLSCHALSQDDQPNIQNALNYAGSHGPPSVLLPPGFCWPIGRHLWVPPGVEFYGIGRNFGDEETSTGSLLIANANWATNNTTFPYSQMVWVTGHNQTGGTYLASGLNDGGVVHSMEINCGDMVGCGNMFLLGRQEKSRNYDVIMTGGVPFSGGYSYGVYEQGVDCGGGGSNAPPGHGCLIAQDPSFSGNAFSGQQGPDERLEIFPSYHAAGTANFVPWALMGANQYKGLRDTTINGDGTGSGHALYYWGEASTMGPGVHVEGGYTGAYLGNIPAGSTCNGASQTLFTSFFDQPIVIPNCGAQQDLTFTNIAAGVTNNQFGAPVVTVSDVDYYYDQATQSSGPLGIKTATFRSTSEFLSGSAEYAHTGFNGLNFFNGTTHSGLNAQPLLDTGSLGARAHISSNLWWNTGAQNFVRSSNGGNDYADVHFINGGGVCISTSGSISSPVSEAQVLTNCGAIVSGNRNLLVGPGWMDTSTGNITGEGSQALQVNGAGTFTSTVNSSGFLVGGTAGATTTVACTTGQHISGITVSGGLVVAVGPCN